MSAHMADYLASASLSEKVAVDALVLLLLGWPAYRLGRWAERRRGQ